MAFLGDIEEVESELGVIAEFLIDRTGLAELRGSFLWYRTSRWGQWRCAAELEDELLDEHRPELVELIESFNLAIVEGEEGPSGKPLPAVVPHAAERNDANTVDAVHQGKLEEVAQAALRFCAKVDRKAGEPGAGTPREQLQRAVEDLITYEMNNRSPGEEIPKELLEDFDLKLQPR